MMLFSKATSIVYLYILCVMLNACIMVFNKVHYNSLYGYSFMLYSVRLDLVGILTVVDFKMLLTPFKIKISKKSWGRGHFLTFKFDNRSIPSNVKNNRVKWFLLNVNISITKLQIFIIIGFRNPIRRSQYIEERSPVKGYLF